MKLLVIGATGSIGSAACRAAIERGHDVTAFVRSPDKLGAMRDRMTIIEGDLADADTVRAAVAGHDAVISALGSTPDAAQLDVPAAAMRNVLAAMEATGVRRLVGIAGAAVSVPGERKPFGGRVASFLVRLLARNVVEAKQREFEVVRASDVDWTMVRPPNVADREATGRVVIGPTLRGFRISSGDVGIAMVQLAEGDAHVRGAPYLSAGPDGER